MKEGKNKAPLVLMEQLIMLLVFAITALFCVQAVVFSGKISKASRERDLAVNEAQILAETLKAVSGDLEKMQEQFGGTRKENSWTSTMDHTNTVTIRKNERDQSLPKANISIKNNKKKLVFELEVAWQEEEKNE
ncbi:MAG: hypothetical protein RR364_05845 [Lachnospiraceae bacterium]